MRTKDKSIDLANLDFNRFKDNLKQAVEYFSGSPVKKEAKLFETCAIALGDENSDRLAATLKKTEMESASALTLFKAGLCPFTHEPLDSDLVKRLGAELHIDESMDTLIIDRFPEGMRAEDRALWLATHPNGEAEASEQAMDAPMNMGQAPHLHAAIAGYREDLFSWFSSFSDEDSSYTLCYWHSDDPSFRSLPLATRLQYETHYELVLSFMDNGEVQGLHLYRIFKIGDSWQLSQDASLNLYFDDSKGTAEEASLSGDLQAFLSMVVEQLVQRPAHWKAQGARPDQPAFKEMVILAIQRHFKAFPSNSLNKSLEGSVMAFVERSLDTFDYPVVVANRLADPVIHPIG